MTTIDTTDRNEATPADPEVIIRALPGLADYTAPQLFWEELAWYATADDIVIGVVTQNRESDVPTGFAWETLTPLGETADSIGRYSQGLPVGTYRTYDHKAWYRTVEEATVALHAVMRQIHEAELRAAIRQARMERLGPGPGSGEFEVVERLSGEPEPMEEVDVQSAKRHLTERVAVAKRQGARRKHIRQTARRKDITTKTHEDWLMDQIFLQTERSIQTNRDDTEDTPELNEKHPGIVREVHSTVLRRGAGMYLISGVRSDHRRYLQRYPGRSRFPLAAG